MNLFGNNNTNQLIKDMFALGNNLPSWATTSLVRYTDIDDESIEIDVQNKQIHLLVPGLTLKEITVDIDGRILTISAQVPTEKANKFVNSFSKSFKLGDDINVDSISAKYKAGILTISYDYNEQSKSTKVKIVEE